MKSGHFGAFALLGWYLMAPPANYNGSQAVLSTWRIVHSYDTAQACEEARTKVPSPPRGFKVETLELCVASDDPRLKLPIELRSPRN
jgi:hypothetical protein